MLHRATIEAVEQDTAYVSPDLTNTTKGVIFGRVAEFSVRKSFRYRIYPTRGQVVALEDQLAECCRLYNAAIQERRDAWRLERKSIGFYAQDAQLKDIRANGDIAIDNFSVSRNVLRRVDRTFKAFYRRCERREAAGFPRFKSARRFDCCTYSNGFAFIGSKVRLQGIGTVKMRVHRPMLGSITTLSVKREGRKWYAIVSLITPPNLLPVTQSVIGLDVGLEWFATLSDGTHIPNQRNYESMQRCLRVAQRRSARRKRGSKRRAKAVEVLRQFHRTVVNRRTDFQHKLSTELISRYGLIAVEKLNIKGMSRGILSKQIMDASWSGFIDKLRYKAESAGRQLVEVAPQWTSQDCSACGERVKKALSERIHNCSNCGLSLHRDHNAALNILRLGLSLQDVTYRVAESVS